MKITKQHLRRIIREAILESPKILNEINLNFGIPSFGVIGRVLSELDPDRVVKGKNSNLLFDGDYLHWRHGESTVVKWPAIAGITPWNEPAMVDSYIRSLGGGGSSRDWSKIRGTGPTPPGEWYIIDMQARGTQDADSLITLFKAGMEAVEGAATGKEASHNWAANTGASKIAWGNYRIFIHPKSGTQTFGRSRMYIHGGQIAGSHGCIDLGEYMDQFAALYIMWKAYSNRNTMNLTVEYNIENFGDLVDKWKQVWNGLRKAI